jgi:hypothetical protein
MDGRLIISRTEVQCLMIPRYWLFEKTQTIGNIWQRIQIFLNSSIPSQQQLFDNFLANQKWKKYKKKVIDDVKREYRIETSTTRDFNIPVICRIEESD